MWRRSNRPDASPYYGNCVQLKCNHSDARATQSGRSLIQERKSALYGKSMQLSGRPQLSSGCRLEKTEEEYYLQNSVLNSLELREYILGVIVLIYLLSSRCRCVLLLCYN
jgi:hypothetical protein